MYAKMWDIIEPLKRMWLQQMSFLTNTRATNGLSILELQNKINVNKMVYLPQYMWYLVWSMEAIWYVCKYVPF